MVAAVILSAGESKRMDSFPKANLLYKSETFLEIGVRIFRTAEIEKIIVVLGKHTDIIQKKHEHLDVEFIENTDFRKGQLSSIQTAIRTIPDNCEAVIIHQVDQPLVKSGTIAALWETFQLKRSQIILPVCNERRGHPVLFGNEVFDQLLDAPFDIGARKVVWDNEDKIDEIKVNDRGILININTPNDYKNWCGEDLSKNIYSSK